MEYKLTSRYGCIKKVRKMTENEKNSESESGWLAKTSYALFDVGNSAVGAMHATFIFAVYFASTVAPEHGTSYWGYTTGAAALVVAILGPILGGLADSRAQRKLFLGVVVFIGVVATTILWKVEPNESFIWFALVFSFFSILANELMFVFYNALLPSVASKENMGRISGIGWAVGYFGAIVALVIALAVFIMPEKAPFGLDKDSSEHVRATMVLAGIWLLIFSLPLFFFVREGSAASQLSKPWQIISTGWAEIGKIPGLRRFLIARMLYVDGLTVVFAFIGIFAAKVFGFSGQDVLLFAIAVNFTCGVGALIGGWFDDKLGSFRTIRIALICLIIIGALVLFSPNALSFWIFSLIAGLFIGPVQSASRSLVSHLAPAEHRAQIFGFYMLAGKITSFSGPVVYATVVLWATQSPSIEKLSFAIFGEGNGTLGERAGMITVVLFLIAGYFVLGKKKPG